MKRYTGNKPCAGCGLTGQMRRRDSADSLCDECYEFLKLGRSVKEQGKSFGLIKVGRSSDEYFIDGAAGRELSGSLHHISDFKTDDGNSSQLYDALKSLLATIHQGEKAGYRLTVGNLTFYGTTAEYSVTTEQARSFFDFYKALVAYARAVYADGYNAGQSLLLGLASGEVSLDKFNEAATRKK